MWALRALGAAAKFPFKHWFLSGAAITDQVVFEGAGRGALWDGITGAAGTAKDYATDDKKRAELNATVDSTLDSIHNTRDQVIGAVKDPQKALTDAMTGGSGKDGKKGNLLSSIFGFFKDDDGSINWMNTALTAATAYWGGSKLSGLFGGGDKEGGGLGGSALKLGILATIGFLIYKNFDKIRDFANGILDKFNNKASEIGGSHGKYIGMDPTGRVPDLSQMDLGTAATPPIPNISSTVNKAANTVAVTPQKPAASTTLLGTEFSGSVTPADSTTHKARVAQPDAEVEFESTLD